MVLHIFTLARFEHTFDVEAEAATAVAAVAAAIAIDVTQMRYVFHQIERTTNNTVSLYRERKRDRANGRTMNGAHTRASPSIPSY